MKRIIYSSILMFCGLFLVNCSQDEITNPAIPDIPATRAIDPGCHWICDCHMRNLGWQNRCSACGKEYSEPHGQLILRFSDYIKANVTFTTGNDNDFNRIELPTGQFPAYAPEPWYETTGSMSYYNAIKNSSIYRLTPGYAEAADYAWYRTVRILYPGIHIRTTVEREFNEFRLSEGRNLTGFKGQGLLDASKAAIEAFVNYRK
ncbi:hypothetical protein [Alistipes sp. An54]|uniref:hypothetical protein n=1 Tax=Alistipes sp. An54 TaxID=1965645 RepID=UPI001178383E|nr:hypothetical protein [Alistipes sp. An54]